MSSKKGLIEYLDNKGFSSEIVKAFETIDREDFIDSELKSMAYDNTPLPIGSEATISQPYTIAFMLDLLDLKDNQKILEIGSGSGYVLALIKEISINSEIYGLELNKDIAEKSQKRVNATVINKNGYNGLEEEAPFDRILVSAAFPEIPKHLFSQLKENGILVTPVNQSIYKFIKKEKIIEESYFGFNFVKMQK